MECGKLYLVATPIGNLGDITIRALEILKGVDTVAAEDTRRTIKLLNHFGIKKRMVSYHEHSGGQRTEELVESLKKGCDIALVSDAGTPVISDPGFELVSRCIEEDICVEGIPGANAAVTAVTLSGIDCSRFLFAGFLPSKSMARRSEMERLKQLDVPIVIYESPVRIDKTLSDVCDIWGDTVEVCAARELTKLHEEILRGTAKSVMEALTARGSIKGEFVVVVGTADDSACATDGEIAEELKRLIGEGKTKKEAVALASASFSCPKNRVYKLSLEITD